MIEPLTGSLPTFHGFFTRRGGVSEGPYASLNCSLSGQDVRDNVLENRARVARTLGALPQSLMGVTQVHGAAVATVTDPWPVGEGPRADAMVTDRPGIALGIITADCAPVLFCDREAGVIGAAHAGWRGAVAGVLEATLAAMVSLGAEIARTKVAIGPCIGQASYEVGPDLRDAVLPTGGRTCLVDGRDPVHWQFDLRRYCGHRLASAGVQGWFVSEADTAADAERFFSHRRRTLAGGGLIGHQMSAIVL
jgi:YfiH family protein